MNVDLFVWVVIAVMFVVVLVVLFRGARTTGNAYQEWQQFGAERGFGFERNRYVEGRMFRDWSLQGEHGGWPVEIYRRRKAGDGDGDGAGGQTHTVYEVDLTGFVPAGVTLCTQTFVGKAWEAVVGKDVNIGDAAFDAAFIINEVETGAANTLLDDKRRAALLALRDEFDWVHLGKANLRIDNPVLRVRENELQGSSEKMNQVLNTLTQCANVIRG